MSINPLTAIANNAVLDLLQEDAISFKDFGKLLFYDAPKCVGLADALMQYVVENPRPSSRKGRKKRASSSMWTTAVQEEASRIFREVLEEILEIQVGKESEGDTKTDEEIKEAKEENSEASKQGKGRQAPKGKGNANA